TDWSKWRPLNITCSSTAEAFFLPCSAYQKVCDRALSRGKARYLSIVQAICAPRTLMPACKATDRELEEILAAACVVHSVPVAFDAKTADGRTARFERPKKPRYDARRKGVLKN
ncbi:hypothetical protein NKI25_35445, partial [Mesorhizobium sp. M0808]|uniref:hypothetical protein n=1 Tax=Mesorhizobium sp. M0808 TaxID=2957002 RepID=UPI0033399003